jgi:hypothetical protein
VAAATGERGAGEIVYMMIEVSRDELRLICKRLREYESVAARRMRTFDDKLRHRARGRRDAFRSTRKLMRGLFLKAGLERAGV